MTTPNQLDVIADGVEQGEAGDAEMRLLETIVSDPDESIATRLRAAELSLAYKRARPRPAGPEASSLHERARIALSADILLRCSTSEAALVIDILKRATLKAEEQDGEGRARQMAEGLWS